MQQSVKNINRIQRALEEIQKLTPEQINDLSSQQNFNQLRLTRLNNLKSQIFQNQIQPMQSEHSESLFVSQKNYGDRKRRQSGVKWSLFRQMPILGAKQCQRDYQMQFTKKIQQFRRDVKKQQESKMKPQQKIAVPKQQQKKTNKDMFNVVFSNQTGPNWIAPQNQQKQHKNMFNDSLFSKQSQSQPKIQFSNIFANKDVGGSVFNSNKFETNMFPQPFSITKNEQSNKKNQSQKRLLFNVPPNDDKNPASENKSQQKMTETQTKQQTASIKIQNTTGFVPNLTQSKPAISVFENKMQTPQPAPPQPLSQNMTLFSASNPFHQSSTAPKQNIFAASTQNIHDKKNNNIFFNQIKTQEPTTKPAFNIFEKRLHVQETEPVKPIEVKGNLFSSSNPWTQQAKKTPNISSNLFNQNNVQKQKDNTETIKKIQQPIELSIAEQNIQNEKKEPENIFTQKSIPPTFAIFNTKQAPSSDKPPVINPFPQNANQDLFGLNKTNLLGAAQAQPKQQNINYQSGSLFTNNLRITNQPKKEMINQPKISIPLNSLIEQAPPKITPFFQTKKISQPKQEQSKKYEPLINISKTNNINLPNILTGANKEQNQSSKPQNLGFLSTQPKNSTNIFGGSAVGTQQSLNSASNMVNKANKPDVEPEKSKSSSEIFTDYLKSRPVNVFAKDNGSSNISTNQFGSPPSNIFGKTNNLFPKNNNLANTGNIFQLPKNQGTFLGAAQNQNQNQNEDDQQDVDDEEDQNVGEDKFEADPSKSTGNYQYQSSTVLFRENVLKIKRGNQNLIENASVSIQKIAGNKQYHLIVRLANKVIYFTGTILPGVSQVSIINQKQYKNLKVSKILYIGENKKPTSQFLRIQFKQQRLGELFFDKFLEACTK